MVSGQWLVGSGQWVVVSGQWSVGSGGFEISLQRYYIFWQVVGQVRPIITERCIFSRQGHLAGGDACVPGQRLRTRAELRGAFDFPYSVFGNAVFGGYFGVDTHGRHLGAQVFKEDFVVASFALLVNLRLHNSQICYTQKCHFLNKRKSFCLF